MLYRFLTYVNSTSSQTTYANIAYYISNNFSKIIHMNLEELADACYVSQATISRFCRFLGFESFTHFKMECQRSLRDGERRINDICSTSSKGDEEYQYFFRGYGDEIISELKDFINTMDIKRLDQLLDRIHNTSDVALFGIHRCSSVIQELQFSFALKDKFVKAYSGFTHQLECAKTLNEDSLVIVFTAKDGFWFEAHDVVDALAKSKCYKILVTTEKNGERQDIFDEVYFLGSGRGRGSLYVMANYSEAMISRYFTRY
ncbi:DNA-binding MurR/RpiR family transcriptional regulator [Catenibacillus scindens]|uniref:DNA-binding MurR/RpiR family transcriptional regulator n=1 Tax=Catenibacillus scindens TaxID=673271 RepID=A0A7W8H7L0_9FIRM|nr:MurR/RpiR family transcriptional regulator [Catenibacillus scindens]MBB5263203.1 DNA-binding MurR/RpiR family transcriptional regulator [Catenibacillus scindens]